MDNEVKRQGQQQESDTQKRQGFDKDQPIGSPGQRQPDHSKADDRGNRKETDKAARPSLTWMSRTSRASATRAARTTRLRSRK